MRIAVVVVLCTGWFVGCRSSTTTGAVDGGSASPVVADAGESADAAAPLADAADGAPPPRADAASGGACVVHRAASSAGCAEDCGARLTLPGGDRYCTIECAVAKDCEGYGADLICPDTIGACVPRCTGDQACKAGGFARCDAETGGCDTL
ncbi:MAG TPA: hypothetical protein VLT33_01125 [Labilithrix sp.]|nr:hypothetical protein [Labilithrix sp.]